ncbi:NADPH:quinone oxidoreductase family protein [Nocardioides sp. GXZ039]|uniref:NADPH:quinone oxidoreductase family protein n=1 Tax=Nocardioides sp. GXZ039 TaxID=3136018 RepID=UPI0030F37E3D
MRALQVVSLTGPADLVVNDIPEPTPGPEEVLIEVHRVGVAFPDLLQSRGEYQLKPDLPFSLGVDVAGTVVSGPGFEPGQRVAAVISHGGAQELAVAPASSTFALPDSMSYDEAVALPMNYLTAEFALHQRGGLQPGETVLVHGAAGGLGTAVIQVAKGMGARVIAVVSTDAKAEIARQAGADDVVLLEGFKDAVIELTGGAGVDLVADIVGGPAFLDSLRCLHPLGRLIVLGFASGLGIPEVKVNRLLLTNTDVRGAGWGAYAMATPGYMQEQWARLVPMIDSGVIKPLVGQVYDLEDFGQALVDLDERRAVGKLVVRVRD